MTASWSPSRRLFALTEKHNVPLSMTVELTRRCHLHCVHCYLDETQTPNTPQKLSSMKGRELSAAEWGRVFRELAEAGGMHLVLTGGEVFLRRDLLEIAASARRLGFGVRIFTTAMHVTVSAARRLAELGIEGVEVSLYGGQRTHAAVTLCGSAFEQSLAGVRRLRQAGVEVTLKTPVMTLNAGEYGEVIRLAAELGCRFSFDPTVTPRNSGAKDTLAYRLTARELDRIFSDPRLIPPAAPQDMEAAAFAEQYESMLCSAGRNAGSIDPYGNVYPCMQWQVLAGNVRHESFHEIWRGSSVLESVRGMKAPVAADPSGGSCSTGGGYCNSCPGLARLENGNPFETVKIARGMEASIGSR